MQKFADLFFDNGPSYHRVAALRMVDRLIASILKTLMILAGTDPVPICWLVMSWLAALQHLLAEARVSAHNIQGCLHHRDPTALSDMVRFRGKWLAALLKMVSFDIFGQLSLVSEIAASCLQIPCCSEIVHRI